MDVELQRAHSGSGIVGWGSLDNIGDGGEACGCMSNAQHVETILGLGWSHIYTKICEQAL